MYPYKKLNWYPHMMPADVAIWERFIDNFPYLYDSVEYDVHVGTVPAFVLEHDDKTMRGEIPLYKRKIDVVGHSELNLDIIELKPRAGMAAIGQIKGYTTLYERDMKPTKKPRGVIITDTADSDVKEIAKQEGIKIIEV